MPNFRSLPSLGTKKSLAMDHERLLSLINNMTDGVIATDEKARIVLCNSVALNILDSNSLQGHDLGEAVQLLDSQNNPIDIQKLVLGSDRTTSSRDWKLSYGDGSQISIYFSASPVHLGFGTGGQRGYVILLRDITREKSLEEEREEFISVAGHELRTPIAVAEGSISNVIMLAEREHLSTEVKKTLSIAYDQILFLGNLISDLTMLSRAERGKLSVTVENIDVNKLARELASDYQPQATKKNLNFNLQLETQSRQLFSSQLYVREILQNFITNSIKYTQSGCITLAVKPQTGGVLFEVSDSGLGISKGDQSKLFSKFFRSEDSHVRKTSGSGLGLYVAAKLTHLINARLGVESELGKGSRFTIFVPNLPRPEQAQP